MTGREAALELDQVNTWLRQAVENALEMKAAATEIPASLERIAEALDAVAAAPAIEDADVLKPKLDVLRSRMRQLQMLLDSAASFYCASIARSRAGARETYTASGTRMTGAKLHQLQLKA